LVIYIDSSIALACLLLEPRSPPEHLWQERLVSSQLLEYEVWNRVHAYNLAGRVGDQVQGLLRRVGMIEMTRSVLAKALEPLPLPLRTLDSLHLATMDFVRSRGEALELASYDHRLVAAAQALGIPLAAL
jgi:predicted nucleic acid-binding protein